MTRIFGTDGVRGIANAELTTDLALKLGMAAAYWMAHHQTKSSDASTHAAKPFMVIGRDTRLSGEMLGAALSAGIAAMGVDVLDIGIVPTPAVSQVVLSCGACAGVVISASHNPFPDNGIKFFGRNGKKLPDSVEDEIQSLMDRLGELQRPTGGDIGRIIVDREPVADYLAAVEKTLSDLGEKPFAGMKLVADCADGAVYAIAPQVLEELGAEVVALHIDPNGVNINVDCGSTHPAEMQKAVVASGAHAGLAFDGDADRVMLADEKGNIVDGDRMMALIALSLKQRNELSGNVVVATIMSNVGLEKALEAEGIQLHRTDVGDRYVMEGMDKLGGAVGGEQSGHILLPHVSPTGDGLITALQVLRVMKETGKPLSELAGIVENCPQRLEKVKVADKTSWRTDPEVQAAIIRNEKVLGNPVWLSVRPSGTEPVIRVMAQGTDACAVDDIVEELCTLIRVKWGV